MASQRPVFSELGIAQTFLFITWVFQWPLSGRSSLNPSDAWPQLPSRVSFNGLSAAGLLVNSACTVLVLIG